MFTSGDRASWLNAIAAKIMDGGDSPPSLIYLTRVIPGQIVTGQNDGHVTAAAALGENARDDYKAGQRIIVEEMVNLLREQGYVGGNDDALTWMKPLDGTWRVDMPEGDRQLTVFGQRERRMSRDRAIVGERDEIDGSRIGVPSIFETGKGQPLELLVESSRGNITTQKFAIHPLALIIPPMTEREREGLRGDIERNGVKAPIVIYQKKILDGRNRAYHASVLKKPIRIWEFEGTEEDARRFVISLNIFRRHLNALQLAVFAEEQYGPKADKIVADALAQGRIRGNQNRVPSPTISSDTGSRNRGPQRDEIVAELAKADGIKTTGYAVGGAREIVKAPQTLAQVKGGKYHKTRDAVAAALKEQNKSIPVLLPEMKPRSIIERQGICIDNLNKMLIDLEMRPGETPELMSERAQLIIELAIQHQTELRRRKMIP
jgi:hypothetical protein